MTVADAPERARFIQHRGVPILYHDFAGFKDPNALAAANKAYVRASAVVGVSRLQRVILYAVTRVSGRTFATFDDVDAAKDWLAAQG